MLRPARAAVVVAAAWTAPAQHRQLAVRLQPGAPDLGDVVDLVLVQHRLQFLVADQLAPQRQVRGINNQVQSLSLVRIASLRIGPELHRNVPALVGEALLGDMVIGTPWLLNHRLFISYANERVFVAVPPGMPAQPGG